MPKEHHYKIISEWKGNRGTGTSAYRDYSRDFEVAGEHKQQVLLASSDRSFLGDKSRYNPEELLVAALSSCHMLSVLHLCADSGIIVTGYKDEATGCMIQNADGSGQFKSVALNPVMTITESSKSDLAIQLHHKAHEVCFIARSVNFEVSCLPKIVVEQKVN